MPHLLTLHSSSVARSVRTRSRSYRMASMAFMGHPMRFAQQRFSTSAFTLSRIDTKSSG